MTSPVTSQWMGALHNYAATTTVHVPNWHCIVYRGGAITGCVNRSNAEMRLEVSVNSHCEKSHQAAICAEFN